MTPGTEQVSAATMEISHVLEGDVHEVVMRGTDTTRCLGGEPASTITATGRRQTDRSNVSQLALAAELTCDDGSTPVPRRPKRKGCSTTSPSASSTIP